MGSRYSFNNECIKCRGTKYLCGLTYCPLLIEVKASLSMGTYFKGRSLDGASPPSVYIGWRNYPRVTVSLVSPPFRGNTSNLDLPESWLDMRLEDLIGMRLSLVRAATSLSTYVTDIQSRSIELVIDVALSEKPVDVSVVFSKPPRSEVLFDPYIPPMGPVGVAKEVNVGNTRYGRHVEKVFNDTDLKASNAIIYLYTSGVPVSRIARVLSVGALGLGKSRKLVPTRWAITATDKVISDYLVSRIKQYPPINEVRVHSFKVSNNLFVAILIPSSTWLFEWLEAWFPGTTWNRYSPHVIIEGDYEGPSGRSTYPGIGGCYYASRLAVAEYLSRLRRKAAVVVLREVYEGFNINIGVWFVRECVRKLLSSSPKKLVSINEVRKELNELTRLGYSTWVRKSFILRKYLLNRSLSRWFRE